MSQSAPSSDWSNLDLYWSCIVVGAEALDRSTPRQHHAPGCTGPSQQRLRSANGGKTPEGAPCPGVSTSPPQHSRPTQAKAQQGSEQPGVIIQHAPKSCVRQRASIGWPALINLALPFQCPLPAARCPWRARAEPRDNLVAFKVACVDHCAM